MRLRIRLPSEELSRSVPFGSPAGHHCCEVWRAGDGQGRQTVIAVCSMRTRQQLREAKAEAFSPPRINEMNWIPQKYCIRLENGDEESVIGIGNGLFGLSAGGVLTHLRTGYRVARFPDQAAGRAAGDYLAVAYAAEFAALDKAFRKSMTYDQYRALAETAELNDKITGDRDFNRRLAEAGVVLTGGEQ